MQHQYQGSIQNIKDTSTVMIKEYNYKFSKLGIKYPKLPVTHQI